MPYEEDFIFVDEFEVRIQRKRVKGMRMRVVPPDCHVEISAPLRMPVAKVEEFVRAKHSWIVLQQKNARFWTLVESCLPDYKHAIKLLKE